MNTYDFNSILGTMENYGGTYSSDTLPKILENNIVYICNTQKSTKQGEHWLALCGTENEKIIEIFDSFGKKPFEYRFLKNLARKKGLQYIYSKRQLQTFFSSVCGMYVTAYVLYKKAGYSLFDYISCFSTNTLRNDKKVLNFINKKFRRKFKLYNLALIKRALAK